MRPVTIIIDGYPTELESPTTPRCRWTFTFLDGNTAAAKKEDFDDVLDLLSWAYNNIKATRVKIMQEDNNIKNEIDKITNGDSKKENDI
jgi:hypothetical protein